MAYWIVLCTVWFNFVLGALIPITPKLNEEMAGVAFSAFVFVKILVFIPAGWISDRLGHFAGFFIGLVSQAATMWLIIKAPDYVWAARSAEGISLAFGTVSGLALMRSYATSKEEFGKFVAMMMGIGSSGVLLGPFFGYNVSVEQGLTILFIGSVVMICVHWLLYRLHLRALVATQLTESSGDNTIAWAVLIAFALVKGLGVGTEPLLGWWASKELNLPDAWAGFTFVAAAAGFMMACWKPKWMRAWAGVPGVLMLEAALAGQHIYWWPGLVCLGLFSGTLINLSLARLGWSKFENIGVQNSKFLLLSDLPMMVLPGILWELREPQQIMLRLPLLMILLVAALLFSKGRV